MLLNDSSTDYIKLIFDEYNYTDQESPWEAKDLIPLLQEINANLESLNNPYHNSKHTKNVISRVKQIISNSKLSISPKQKFLILLAALMHDYDHSGTSTRSLNRNCDLPNISNEEYAVLQVKEKFSSFLSEKDIDFISQLILATTFYPVPNNDPALFDPISKKRDFSHYDDFTKVLILSDLGGFFDGFDYFYQDSINVLLEFQKSQLPRNFETFLVNIGNFLEQAELSLVACKGILNNEFYVRLYQKINDINDNLKKLINKSHPSYEYYKSQFEKAIQAKLTEFNQKNITQTLTTKSKNLFENKFLFINLTSVFFVMIHLLLYTSFIGQRIEPLVMDLWFQIRGPKKPPSNVIIVGIDEESYSQFDVSPLEIIPRNKHTQLINILREQKAKKVVFDFIFKGQSKEVKADLDLAEAMLSMDTVIGSSINTQNISKNSKDILVHPEAIFAESVNGIGNITLKVDQGVVRRFPYYSINNHKLHSIVEVAAREYLDPNNLPKMNDYINFYGPAGTIRTVPLHYVIQNKDILPTELFNNKIVYVGFHLSNSLRSESKGNFVTPYYGNLSYAVEIHATATANIINKDWIERIELKYEVLIFALWIYGISFLVLSAKPYISFFIIYIAICLWSGISYWLFSKNIFVPGFTCNFVIMPVLFLTSLAYYYLVIAKNQSKMKSAFSRYLQPEMVEDIVKSSKPVALGGKLTEVTILFTDITRFTSWMEKIDPTLVSQILNDYFTEIASVVLKSNGTLVKFIGDGMFVIWGAPEKVNNPSDKALKSALIIQERIKLLSQKQNYPYFHTRIGIHRDTVLVGNFGSEARFDYTAMGDGVNTASRLEELNKVLGTDCLFSKSVLENLSDTYQITKIAKVKLYGKNDPIEVYTILENNDDNHLRSLWYKALNTFSNGAPNDSIVIFEKIASYKNLLSRPAKFYLSYIEKNSKNLADTTKNGVIDLNI